MPSHSRKHSPKKKKKEASRLLTNTVGNEPALFETLGPHGYMNVIFPLLEKIMECSRGQIRYHILGTDNVFESEDEVRRYLCIHGIPRAHLLNEKELETLSLWACYAEVLPSDFTSKYPELSQFEIQTVLQTKLDLVRNDATGSFKRGGNARHDTEEWDTLECVREFLRGHGLAAMNRFGVRKLSPVEKANIRVWAARSTRPLPQHAIATTSAAGSVDVESNGARNMNLKTPDKRRFPFQVWPSSQRGEKEENRPKKKARVTSPDEPTSWFSGIRSMFSSSSKSDG